MRRAHFEREGIRRDERTMFRVARRTIRRVIIISAAALIIYGGKKYYVDNKVAYPVMEVDGTQVIEDPKDESAYIELKIQ